MEEQCALLTKELSLLPIVMVFKAACLEVLRVIVFNLFIFFHESVLQDS